MKNLLFSILLILSCLTFTSETKAVDSCFIVDVSCMYEELKVPYGSLHLSTGYRSWMEKPYGPISGMYFINPNNTKELILGFEMGKHSKFYFSSNERYTLDIDIVNNSNIDIDYIKHNLPDSSQAGRDTSLSDLVTNGEDTITATLNINRPDKLGSEYHWVIFRFKDELDGSLVHLNWQLGYHSQYFYSTAHKLEWFNDIRKNQSAGSAVAKIASTEAFIQAFKTYCLLSGLSDACQSFALDTDSFHKVSIAEYVFWEKQLTATVKDGSNLPLGNIANLVQGKVTKKVSY